MNISLTSVAALAVATAFIALLAVLKRRFHLNFGSRVLIATVLGVVLGLTFGKSFEYYAIIGTIYANVIAALVVPLLFFSIISSITNLSDMLKLKTIGLKSVFFLMLNTLTASVITLAIAVPLHIGTGFSLEGVQYQAHEVPTAIDTIVSLFPSNLAEAWASNAVVPIILFALMLALAYIRLVSKPRTSQATEKNQELEALKPFKAFVDAANKILGETISWVVSFTPYAVVALIGRAVGRTTVAQLLPLLGVMAVAYIALAIQFFIVQPGVLALTTKLNPLSFLRGITPAGVTAFTTQSSIGTIPVTVRSLTQNLGVHEDIASFTAGLGANLGMPGCAGMWPTLVAVFALGALGTPIQPAQIVMIVLLALVISVGTVGVPGTATITATAMLAALGLPVETIALVAPISSLVDMGRTATNVAGAAEAAVVVAKLEDQLDTRLYNQKNLQAQGQAQVAQA